jgi:hypothetical protein
MGLVRASRRRRATRASFTGFGSFWLTVFPAGTKLGQPDCWARARAGERPQESLSGGFTVENYEHWWCRHQAANYLYGAAASLHIPGRQAAAHFSAELSSAVARRARCTGTTTKYARPEWKQLTGWMLGSYGSNFRESAAWISTARRRAIGGYQASPCCRDRAETARQVR